MKGEYQARGPKMATYMAKVKGNLDQLEQYTIEQIPREQNMNVDALAKLASTQDGDTLESISVEYRPNQVLRREKFTWTASPRIRGPTPS